MSKTKAPKVKRTHVINGSKYVSVDASGRIRLPAEVLKIPAYEGCRVVMEGDVVHIIPDKYNKMPKYGRISIHSPIRKKLDLTSGCYLKIEEINTDRIVLKKVDSLPTKGEAKE